MNTFQHARVDLKQADRRTDPELPLQAFATGGCWMSMLNKSSTWPLNQ